MEGLQSRDEIDDEIMGGYFAVKELLGVDCQLTFFTRSCIFHGDQA